MYMENYNETKAKFLLGSIGIANVVFSIISLDTLLIIVIQSYFGGLLYKGNKYIRWLYIFGATLGLMIAIYIRIFFTNTNYHNNYYFILYLLFASFILFVLLFNKDIKTYINITNTRNKTSINDN